MRRLMPLAAVLALVLSAPSCGSDAPAAYTDETRGNVLTACRAETDRPLVGDVCACAYRSIRSRVSYERFEEIDRQLREAPTAPLPDEVVAVLAECVIDVANL